MLIFNGLCFAKICIFWLSFKHSSEYFLVVNRFQVANLRKIFHIRKHYDEKSAVPYQVNAAFAGSKRRIHW